MSKITLKYIITRDPFLHQWPHVSLSSASLFLYLYRVPNTNLGRQINDPLIDAQYNISLIK